MLSKNTIKLKDIAVEISERINDPSKSGYDIFVGLEHLDSGSLFVNRWGSTKEVKSAMKLFKAGDILFARRNTYLKRASIARFDGVCSGDIIVLRQNDILMKDFLILIMNLEKFWDFAISNSAGTMSKRAKWRDICEFEIEFLSKIEEKQISDIIFLFEKSIEDKMILLEDIARYKNKKVSNIINGEIYADKKSDKKKLKELVEIKYGDSPKNILDENGEYCVYGTGGITGRSNQYLYNQESVIIGRKGTIDKPLYVDEPFWCIDTTFYIVPKVEVNIKWLYYAIKNIRLEKYNEATGVPSLNRSTLYNIEIEVPKIEVQNIIVQTIESIEMVENNINLNINDTKDLRNKVLNEMIICKI